MARYWHLLPVKPLRQWQAMLRKVSISRAKHTPPCRHWVMADSAKVHAGESEIIV